LAPLLALDARNFAHAENAVLQLGQAKKCASNPLFREDFFADPPKPWEARLDNVYPSVIYDEDEGLFKCWYKSFIVDEASVETPLAQRPQTRYTGGKREEGLLYATSNDGVHWQKPTLGLIEFGRSHANNLVMRRATQGIHAGGVLTDPRDPDPARRDNFIHRTGHGIGVEVHEPPYVTEPNSDPIEVGHAFSIEPGIYFIDALLGDPARREKFAESVVWERADELRGFGGIRIEDDVLVTDGDPEVLTAAIAKPLRIG